MPGVPQTLPVPPLVNEMTMLNAIRLVAGGGGGGAGTVTSVSVVTANGVSATVATATTTPALTFTLGAITPTSVNALTLAAAATGFTIAGGTSSKTLTVLDTGTAALLGIAQTFSAANIFSVNGAASTPALSLTGTPFTGGTATTTKPLFSIEPTGATSTAWSTSGTMLGVNCSSTFVGNLLDVQKNGSARFKVDADGVGTLGSTAIGGAATVLNLVSSFGTCVIQITGGGAFVTSSVLSTNLIYCPGIIFANDVFLNRKAAASFGLGNSSATPITQTFGGADGSGTNITGGTLNIGTRGTGTGTGGVINFQSHAAGASSSTLGTLVNVLSISSSTLVTVASGAALRLGNAATTGLVPGVEAALTNATITLQDSGGTTYRIPCII